MQYDGKTITVPPGPLPYDKGMGEFFFDRMRKYKDSVAQIDGITGEKDTYGSMLQRSIRTAITMRSKGVSTDDIISVCSSNHLDVHIPIIASMFLGVKFASIDPTFILNDAIHLLKQVQPKIIFVSPSAVKLIEDALPSIGSNAEVVVFGPTDTHTPFKDFLQESPEEEEFEPKLARDLKETFSIFFSSGTTGLPKGICWNHLMLLGQMASYLEVKDHNGGVFLAYSSIYWASSFFYLLMAATTGSARLILPGFDVKTLLDHVEKYKVSMVFLTANQIATVLSEKLPDKDISSLKTISSGGASVTKEQLCELRRLFPSAFVTVGYGQTEIGGAVSFKPENPEDVKLMLEKPDSCGRTLAGYSIKIVDPATEEVLGMNQRGELRVKTNYQMNGYHNIDSSSAWDSEGYIKTGDVAYYDEHLCFFIVDRIKEMFKFRGIHVIPSKLEGVLRTHPAVENAVVFGIPHPADNFHPTAVVLLKSGAVANPEEIRDFVAAKVADAEKLRGGIRIVGSIPETPSGKYRRNYTRDLFLEGKI